MSNGQDESPNPIPPAEKPRERPPAHNDRPIKEGVRDPSRRNFPSPRRVPNEGGGGGEESGGGGS